jgi:hypothetical protein
VLLKGPTSLPSPVCMTRPEVAKLGGFERQGVTPRRARGRVHGTATDLQRLGRGDANPNQERPAVTATRGAVDGRPSLHVVAVKSLKTGYGFGKLALAATKKGARVVSPRPRTVNVAAASASFVPSNRPSLRRDRGRGGAVGDRGKPPQQHSGRRLKCRRGSSS